MRLAHPRMIAREIVLYLAHENDSLPITESLGNPPRIVLLTTNANFLLSDETCNHINRGRVNKTALHLIGHEPRTVSWSLFSDSLLQILHYSLPWSVESITVYICFGCFTIKLRSNLLKVISNTSSYVIGSLSGLAAFKTPMILSYSTKEINIK